MGVKMKENKIRKRKRESKHKRKHIRNRKRKRERKRQHKRNHKRDENPDMNPKYVGKDATKQKITRRSAITESNPIISLLLWRADRRADRRTLSAQVCAREVEFV